MKVKKIQKPGRLTNSVNKNSTILYRIFHNLLYQLPVKLGNANFSNFQGIKGEPLLFFEFSRWISNAISLRVSSEQQRKKFTNVMEIHTRESEVEARSAPDKPFVPVGTSFPQRSPMCCIRCKLEIKLTGVGEDASSKNENNDLCSLQM